MCVSIKNWFALLGLRFMKMSYKRMRRTIGNKNFELKFLKNSREKYVHNFQPIL